MTLPLQFLGYGVRCTDVPRGWATNTPVAVDEICSVSDCVNSRPEGWVERWDYNSACCYETEEAATRTAEGRPGFRLLAYALVMVRLNEKDDEIAVDLDAILPPGLPALPAEPVPDGLAVLGYDVVSKQGANYMDFECSPLSCCGLAGEVPVNRYCLLDDFGTALRVAQRWDREEPEPGPYYVVQVLRRP